MKKKFSQMSVGEEVDVELLLLSFEVKQGKNGAFTLLKVSDGEANCDVRYWGDISQVNGVSAHSIITVQLKADTYQGSMNFTSSAVRPYSGTDAVLGDFVIMPPVDIDEMYNYIIDTLTRESVAAQNVIYSNDGRNEPISNIALSLIQNNSEVFKRSVAAVSVHHNIYGGLLYHTYGMVKAAEGLASAMPFVDRELLITGCAIHDIGKIYTYTTDDIGAGNLNNLEILDGHLAIGYAAVSRESRNHACAPERVHLLQHMVASHHGKPEWGAIVKPSTPEAFLLFAIDYIDSRMYMYREAQNSVAPGEYSPKIFGLDSASVYRPTYLN